MVSGVSNTSCGSCSARSFKLGVAMDGPSWMPIPKATTALQGLQHANGIVPSGRATLGPMLGRSPGHDPLDGGELRACGGGQVLAGWASAWPAWPANDDPADHAGRLV